MSQNRAVRVALALGVLVGLFGTATAGAQSTCGDLGGTLNPDQTCEVRRTTADYAIDFSYPVSYPDQQGIADYLISLRDHFVQFRPNHHPSTPGRIRYR